MTPPGTIWAAIRGRKLYLLLALIGLLLLYPSFQAGPHGALFMLLLNSATLIGGVYAVSEKRSHVVIAISIAVPQIIVSILTYSLRSGNELIRLLANLESVLLIVFYVFTLLLVYSHVISGTKVTRDRLYGAVSAYLLIGMAWASGYRLLEGLHPGSFVAAQGSLDFIYYSFTTLTTLGYGDILPVTARARSFAILEALAGVMYVAITIARLVSLYRSGDSLRPDHS